MKTQNARSWNVVSRVAVLIDLVACSLALTSSVEAYEDPPGCSLNNGGTGATYESGLEFMFAQAHLGDAVPVFPKFGMDSLACRAIHVTGSVYIATGKMLNFLNDANIEPGMLAYGTNPPCAPGNYSLQI